jgi:hypothetical protein
LISELSRGLQCHQCRTGDSSRLHQVDEGGDPRLLHQCYDCLTSGAECGSRPATVEDVAYGEAYDDPYLSLWHDGSMAELEIVCGICDRDICHVSGYVGGRSAWEIALGRDLESHEIRTGRSFGSDIDPQHRDLDGTQHHLRWTLVCPGRHRPPFQRVVKYERVRDAMVKAWYSGSHRLVAGVDL